ncbi:aminoglycoside adenylyltransferase family protein [Streptomyces sp. NPDC091406]|uniref:aminoglycoside adenylyltransferase family protein n=1 Tax=unclassified Streptomyces TaxID=2593676 RepID=UPI00381936B6
MNQLREIAALAGDALGGDLIGAYLHGSSVLGGLRPASDVDVLLVSRRPMDERERRALLGGLLRISGSGHMTRPVEVTVVVQSEVKPWRYPPICDFLYGEWLRAAYEAGKVPRSEPSPDLALLISMTLAGDSPLTGPRPAQVLDPVPHSDLVRASVAGLPELLGDLEGDTRNVLLTLGRVWATLSTGRIMPKDAAAAWAIGRLPPEHRAVLEHARQLYLNCHYSEERWSETLRTQVRPYADHVLAEIEQLRSKTG